MAAEIRSKKQGIFYPARTIIYPDGYYESLIASKPVFKESQGWEPVRAERLEDACGRGRPQGEAAAEGPSVENLRRAARRAGVAVRRLAHCADMRYFVTLTLDGSKINRYNEKEIVRKMSTFCDNAVRRKGLCYILVPERHKDGAIHFHGFFNGALPAVDSGTISLPGKKKPRKPRSPQQRAQWLADGGQIVYNLPSWGWGFSTAIELYGDKDKAISYTCKYIVKEMQGGKIGGRWYYHGGHFEEPQVIYLDITAQDILYNPAFEKEYHKFEIPETGTIFCMKRGRMS